MLLAPPPPSPLSTGVGLLVRGRGGMVVVVVVGVVGPGVGDLRRTALGEEAARMFVMMTRSTATRRGT